MLNKNLLICQNILLIHTHKNKSTDRAPSINTLNNTDKFVNSYSVAGQLYILLYMCLNIVCLFTRVQVLILH